MLYACFYFHLLLCEIHQEISVDERVKGYKYGATYIPVTTADEDSFKIASPAGVTVIGKRNSAP